MQPAAGLAEVAVRAGARLVIVNLDPTPYDPIAHAIVREQIGTVLPRLVAHPRGVTITALRRPRRLVPGDRVAVVAPSGPIEPERLARGCAVLESWGLDVVTGAHVLDRAAHLAGADEDRAADIEQAWCDPEISAVLCARGGSGATRLLDLLDWDAMLRAEPKVFVGYSDATALHEALATRLGLSSLFGPMPAALPFGGESPDLASLDHLRTTLFQPERVQVLRGDGTAPAWCRGGPPA